MRHPAVQFILDEAKGQKVRDKEINHRAGYNANQMSRFRSGESQKNDIQMVSDYLAVLGYKLEIVPLG